MANQLLALQIERPRFSYPEAHQDAQTLVRGNQQIEQGRMANERAGMELQDYAEESGALRDYRDAARADDPNAMDRLKGFPEIQAKVHQALESMKPDELIKAKINARAMGEAAAYVKRFQPGSPEERAAWDKVLGDLTSQGIIDEGTASHWKQAGPSDLIIDQADMMADLVGGYLRKDASKIPESVKAVEDGVAKFRQTITPDDIEILSDERRQQIEDQVAAERMRLEQLYGGNRRRAEPPPSALSRAEGRTAPVVDEAPDLADGPATRGVAPDNARQVPLTRPRAVNPKTGETIEYDAEAGAWVPVDQ